MAKSKKHNPTSQTEDVMEKKLKSKKRLVEDLSHENEPQPERKKKKKSSSIKVKPGDLICENTKNIVISQTKLEDVPITSIDQQEEDEEEGLTAEEKRILERKLKKERKKLEKKNKKASQESTMETAGPGPAVAAELALQYLRCWYENRQLWKFQKTRQTWLLQHMYDKQKVPDEDFDVLLEYLEGLQGSARATTVSKAESVVRDHDDAEEMTDRARQIIQLLS
ncbi:uncharacterized protein C7orf50 homolog isoform X1 [Polypterus senegalus]|uniref:uncharacterized protein C7orf50 homolog isoform X1 n=1 Tax=Polypterus senegalus TaxID=55291 RepID=UPI001962A14A|nr:uncharacterized protein C7orf50 homolog isoform X1 [Polypterus senegalus]